MTERETEKEILARFRSEPRLGPRYSPRLLDLAEDGTLTLEGDVPSVAAKKRALALAASHEDVRAVVDRLRLEPAAPTSDAGIRSSLRRYFLEEPSFQGFAVREASGGGPEPVLVPVGGDAPDARWRVDYEVRDGVVILNGKVPGLVSKRLAGVMAWWVPGVRDVVNGLEPDPPEEDAPIRIAEAVRIVLDRDPYVDDTQVRIGVEGRVVRLTGLLPTAAHRDMAEHDAWCVFGVEQVINEIECSP